MRRSAVFVVVAWVASAAGCVEEADGAAPSMSADAVTKGVWVINGNPDRMLFWAQNPNDFDVLVRWNMTLADGQPLPSDWSVAFSDQEISLGPVGTKKEREGNRFDYLDWGWTVATLRVPSTYPAGSKAVELNLGEASVPLRLDIKASRTQVSQPGDQVHVEYVGRFSDNREEFDSGEFPTTLGSGQTVVGFDYGLMGLAVSERAALLIPPALAYGYDNTDPGYTKFNGRWLQFDVKIRSISTGSRGPSNFPESW